LPDGECGGCGAFFRTGPVIAILAGDLFTAKPKAISMDQERFRSSRAQARPHLPREFTHSAEFGNAGSMQCSDGATGRSSSSA